jgi:quercetin dioxygenase-like cupin family protein
MSSINRPLSGPTMTFNLAAQLQELRREEAYARSGRAGRTLAKSGRFRVTLVAVAEGVLIGTHQADSPMTLQIVQGGLRWRDEAGEHEMRQGELLFFGPGSAEDIRSTADSALLITISAVGDDFQPGESSASATGLSD